MDVKTEQLLVAIETKQQLAKDLRNSYLSQWRKNNPEKVKRYRQNYWDRRAEEMLISSKNN